MGNSVGTRFEVPGLLEGMFVGIDARDGLSEIEGACVEGAADGAKVGRDVG